MASSPKEVAANLGKALSSGDLEGVLSLYEDDAVFVAPGEPWSNPVRGKGAMRETTSQFLAMDPTLTVEVTKIIEVDEIALVTGDWSLKGKGPDGDISMSGTYTDVMRRQADGTWLYVIDNPDGVA